MATEQTGPIDYQAVLADLRAKRDQIELAITAIEAMATGQSIAAGSYDGGSAESSKEIREDEFFGMSITDAAKKYLAKRKRAQTTQDIADALDKGGLTHSSGNWANTVGSVLMRSEKTGGEVVRVKRGTWGLAVWYPGRRKPIANDKSKVEVDEDIDPTT